MRPIYRTNSVNGVSESMLYDTFDNGYSSDESLASTLRHILRDCAEVPSASELLDEAKCGIMDDSFDDMDESNSFDSVYSDGQFEDHGLVPFALPQRVEKNNDGLNKQSGRETRSSRRSCQRSRDLDDVRDKPKDESFPSAFEIRHTNRDIEMGLSDPFAFSEGSVTSKDEGATTDGSRSIRPSWSMTRPFSGIGQKVATLFKSPLGAGSLDPDPVMSDQMKGNLSPPDDSSMSTSGVKDDVIVPWQGKIGVHKCEIALPGVEEIHGGEAHSEVNTLPRTVSSGGVAVADEVASLEVFQSFEVLLESQTVGSGTSSPMLKTSPTIISPPMLKTSPTIISPPMLKTSPTIISPPMLKTSPTIISSPKLETSPSIINSPILETSPSIIKSPILETSPSIINSPSIISSPTLETSPSIAIVGAPGSYSDGRKSHQGTLPPLNIGKSLSSKSILVGGPRSSAISVSHEIEEESSSVNSTTLANHPKDEAPSRSRVCTRWRLLMGTMLLAVVIIVAVTASLTRNEGNTIALASGDEPQSSPSQILVSSPSQAPTYPPNYRAGQTRAPSSSRTQLFEHASQGIPSSSPSN